MKAKFEDLKALNAALKPDEDGIHQSIMNVGYDWWQKTDRDTSKKYEAGDLTADEARNQMVGMGGMYEHVEANYGDFAVLAIMLGKYNQQVCNGGHHQWFDNGYADPWGGGGFGDTHDTNSPGMERMKELFIRFGLLHLDKGKEVYAIMSEFHAEVNEDEEVEEEVWNEETEEYEMESYTEQAEEPIWIDPSLDDRYYKVNEAWMKALEDYMTNVLLKGRVAILDLTVEKLYTDVKPRVKLLGRDGNAFAILGVCKKAILKANGKETAEAFLKEATSGNYNHVLATAMKYCEVH